MSETKLTCPKCGAAGRPARYSDLFLYDCDSCKDPSAPFYQSPSCRIAEMQATRDAASVRYAHLQGRNAKLTEALEGCVNIHEAALQGGALHEDDEVLALEKAKAALEGGAS